MIGKRWFVYVGIVALGVWASASRAQFAEEEVSNLEKLADPFIKEWKKEYTWKEFPKKAKLEFLYATHPSAPAPLNKERTETLDVLAKYFAYRFTWKEYVSDHNKLESALKEFEAEYNEQILNKNAATPVDAAAKVYFEDKLVQHLKEVFKRDFNKNRVSTINAAQTLAVVAKSRDEKFSDFLTEIVNDAGQSDAVKLFAVRALKGYFQDRANLVNQPDFKQDIKRVEALTNYIERKWPDTKNSQELDAYRYLRREAIQSLAQTQFSAVKFKRDAAGNLNPEGQVAVTLTRVLALNDLEPEPSLAEKCQAAIGLLNIKPRDPYQPALAAYASGTLLNEFVGAYRDDLIKNIKANKPPQLPWKTIAKELSDGFKLQSENAVKGDTLCRDLHAKVDKMLSKVSKHELIDGTLLTDYEAWIKKQAPANKSLFKGNKPEVDLGY